MYLELTNNAAAQEITEIIEFPQLFKEFCSIFISLYKNSLLPHELRNNDHVYLVCKNSFWDMLTTDQRRYLEKCAEVNGEDYRQFNIN